MNLVDITILAVALGIDCLVVSFSQGLIFKHKRLQNSFLLALTMGLFQGTMPCISYFFTDFVDNYIEPYKSLIVFTIFLALGIKFIVESFSDNKDEICCIDLKCLIGMGVATSIDALASGISLKLTDTNLLISAILIGLISLLMSIFGFWTGNFFKKIPSQFLGILGGLILIFLAIKAL